METAAHTSLAGRLFCHPDRTVSAHPLVRDTFRPLALGAADIAAKITLADLPAGPITSREQGLWVVEVIELLMDADHPEAARDLDMNRADSGKVWQRLPAARATRRVRVRTHA